MGAEERVTSEGDELDRMVASYGSLGPGASRLMLLAGPPGSGASQLVERFLEEARPPVALRAVGSRARPLATVRELLAGARWTGAADPVVDLRSYGERRAQVFEEVRQLLARLGTERPPVFVIDDLDRADAATVSLLELLLADRRSDREERAAAFFVGTVTDLSQPLLRDLVGSERATVVRLEALDAAGVRAYLGRPDVVADILERTGGLSERIDDLLAGLPVAPSERAARLSPASQRVLEASAVLDRPASLAELAQIAGVPARVGLVDELERAGLVRRRLRDGVLTVWFRTRALRDTHLASLEDGRRAELHRGAVATLRERYPEEAARHARRGGDHAEAIALALTACDDPTRGLDQGDALALLLEVSEGDPGELPRALVRRIAELAIDAGEGAQALRHARALASREGSAGGDRLLLARALFLVGDLDEADRELAAAACATEEPALQVEIRLSLAAIALRRGRFAEARAEAGEAAREARAGGWLALALEAELVVARAAYEAEAIDESEALAQAGLLAAADAGLARVECAFVNLLGSVEWRRGRLDAAVDLFRRSARIADELGDLRQAASAIGNVAVIDHLRGRLGQAADGYRRSLLLVGGHELRERQARVLNNMASLRRTLGDPRGALELAERAGAMSSGLAFTIENELVRARCLDAIGRHHASEELLRAAEARASEAGLEESAAEARLYLAWSAHDAGEVELARERLDAVGRRTLPRSRWRVALLRAALADAAEAVPLARKAVLAAEAYSDPLAELRARIQLAVALRRAGLHGRMAEELERARQLDERLVDGLSAKDRVTFRERPDALRLLSLEAHAPASIVAPAASSDDRLRGRSDAMRELRGLVARVGPADAIVLITGESGSGKELTAEALHAASRRAERPLLKVNCAALADSLLFSELFGHERGAFTGAHAARKGRFELAHGGTLFLDEIGDVSPKMQAALLRVLQEGTFERVGGTRTLRCDVRVIAATNRDLRALVQEGRFREDLYYRLAGITLEVPPLRERRADLPMLCAALLTDIAPEMGRERMEMSVDALRALGRHRWPGNVRELQNVLRGAVLASDGDVLHAADVRAFLPGDAPEAGEPPPTGEVALDDLYYDAVRRGEVSLYELRRAVERSCVERALSESAGNITHAAELLGMKRSRVSQLVKQHGLRKDGEP